MLITAAQFLCQHVMARVVLGLKRLATATHEAEEAMSWHEWWSKGMTHCTSRALAVHHLPRLHLHGHMSNMTGICPNGRRTFWM